MYVEMLFEYMQRRSELENDDFNEIVEQSNDEEMTTTFKTIFQVAREEAAELATEKAVRAFIRTTQMKDSVIAKELGVSEDFVKKIRIEMQSTQP